MGQICKVNFFKCIYLWIQAELKKTTLENETMIQIQDMFENGKPDIVLKTVKGFYS